MKGFVVRGKTARGRTDFTIGRLEELHRRDPFSYFLLGPTASFTESVRQELLGRGYSPSSTEKIRNRHKKEQMKV